MPDMSAPRLGIDFPCLPVQTRQGTKGKAMTRIDDTFARLRAARTKAFVSYVMAGDPDVPTALAVMKVY